MNKFPEQYREKLRLYTGEELYYVYRLAIYNPKKIKGEDGVDLYRSGDMFYLALKAKLFRWLKGEEKHPIYPSAWDKLGSRFRMDFMDFITEFKPEVDIPALQDKFRRTG